ncbi:MAG: radical SAM protein [Candidatus Omnitrophota bacterium]|nr:radical SAM protein [Candidatus Omnitrophota bacterium]
MKGNILLISLQQSMDVIGLKHMHYSLLGNSYNSTLLFLPYSELGDEQLKAIRKFVYKLAPELIGVSLMSIDFFRAVKVSKFLKGNFNNIPIVWGGYHPTVAPEQCLKYADYVFIGEAEKAIIEIADTIKNNKSLKGIKGLCFKEREQLIKNPVFPLNADIDPVYSHDHIPQKSFILNKREVVVLDKTLFKKHDRFSGKVFYIMSSIGCPLACSYCCNSFFSSLYNVNTIRRRSVSSMISEMEKAINVYPEIEYIDFLDDCFMGSSDKYIDEFCRVYKQKINKPFIMKSAPIFILRDRIHSLKKAGLAWVGLGLQSGSDRINKEVYNRHSLANDFLKAARICNEFRIALYYDVILDNPYETKEDKTKTLEVLMNAPKPCFLQLFSLTYYPGSALYERVKKEHPERIANENVLFKDHIFYKRDRYNNLVRLAAYVPARLTSKIIQFYNQDGEPFGFYVLYYSLNFFSVFLFEPLNYFLSVKLSQGGSYIKTFQVLFIYTREGMRRYFGQFKVLQKRVSYSTCEKGEQSEHFSERRT